MHISLILLAGGKGLRMAKPLPKQFIALQERAIALHSLEVFLAIEQIREIVVVCAPDHRHHFAGLPVRFALPGEMRQDSVYNGLQLVSPEAEWVCTHDAARPFITCEMVNRLFDEGKRFAAASLAMPVKNTLKLVGENQEVIQTLDRASIWEIQTPQLIKKSVLEAGFKHIQSQALNVTDDVSLAELVGAEVKLIQGSYENIKITTPEDLSFAEWIIQKNTVCALPTMEHATVAGRSSPIASLSKA